MRAGPLCRYFGAYMELLLSFIYWLGKTHNHTYTAKLQTCQVLRKSKNEIARTLSIFLYNLVIERAGKSRAQVLRVRVFLSLDRHKLLTENEISNIVLSYPYHLLSTTLNLLSICKFTRLSKYPVPLFVYIQRFLTHDSYANQDSERLNQYW